VLEVSFVSFFISLPDVGSAKIMLSEEQLAKIRAISVSRKFLMVILDYH
jgi:hypothetical protein